MADQEVPATQRRENPEPVERTRPVPAFIVVLVAGLVVFCSVYITRANVDTPSEWGDGRTAAELAGKRPAGAASVDGAALFAAACSACHQATGAGLPGVFPPLAGSEWVNGKEATLAAIVLHGVSGPIDVKGAAFNGAMPAFKAQFSDAQLAAVLSHIRAQWGNESAPVSAATVGEVRQRLAARTAPFAGEAGLQAFERDSGAGPTQASTRAPTQ